MPKIYKIMFFVSISLLFLAIVSIILWGLNLGVDFVGGSVMEIEFKSLPELPKVRQVLEENFTELDISTNFYGDKGIIIKTISLTEPEHAKLFSVIKENFLSLEPRENRFDSIGPVLGKELANKSIVAIIIALSCVMIYIAFVFRKLGSVLSPWIMGVAAILAMLHDVVIPIGVFAILGHFYGVEITAIFIAAMLTIIGFSVSDTVVVFDRVRENIIRYGRRQELGALIHKSVMQTLVRSLNIIFTTLLSLFAIYLFGGETLKFFALAMIIGIFLGSYSSIFVASPILYFWSKIRKQ